MAKKKKSKSKKKNRNKKLIFFNKINFTRLLSKTFLVKSFCSSLFFFVYGFQFFVFNN